jgi:membrane-associated HD superfamily phosphohydrolase
MFSNGQIIFGILFAIAFIVILFFSYRKDLKLHKKYYKGSIWVLIAFIAFLLFIVAIKFFLG